MSFEQNHALSAAAATDVTGMPQPVSFHATSEALGRLFIAAIECERSSASQISDLGWALVERESLTFAELSAKAKVVRAICRNEPDCMEDQLVQSVLRDFETLFKVSE